VSIISEDLKIAGLDEAGRGPVVGPMIIAALLFTEKEALYFLKLAGVKDSKKLLPKKREKLSKMILNKAKNTLIVILNPPTIDAYIANSSLTALEAEIFALALNILKPDVAYIDAASINAESFKKNIAKRLHVTSITLVCEHKADDKYLATAAASIIAKVMRDQLISSIKRFLGNIGSGYPSDPLTRKIIGDKKIIKEYNNFFRISWRTIRNSIYSVDILSFT